MLTAAQCEVVAFANEFGEIYCADCAHEMMDGGEDVSGFAPWIAYVADEYVGENANERVSEEGLPEGCTEDCEPFGLYCERDGRHEIVAPYHYGHTDDGGQEQEPPR